MQEGNQHPEYHSLEEIKDVIRRCLRQLYDKDHILFQTNKGKGLCERCIVFRFGLYLQEALSNFFVDCDFNSSWIGGRRRSGKPITNPNGRTSTKRFVDIIVHKRGNSDSTDYICFEIKKWNSYDRKAFDKDVNNLKILTAEYGYKFGFYLTFGKTLNETKWIVFQYGRIIENENLVCQRRGN